MDGAKNGLRLRRLSLFWGIGAIAGAWLVLDSGDSPGTRTPHGPVLQAAVVPHELRPQHQAQSALGEGRPDSLELRRFQLGRNRTLAATLDEIGLDGEHRLAVERALERELDPRRLRPETGFTTGTDSAGRLRLLSVRPERDRCVRLRLSPDRPPVVETPRIPIVTTVETVGGVVMSSVARALPDTAEGYQLTMAFADVFQWDVDLLVDPRPGDEVRVVYEVQRLGELPEDLPRFGDAPTEAGSFLTVGRILAASYEGSVARSSAFWVEHDEGAGGYYDAQGQALRKTFLKSPLNYRRISSGFSRARRHPITRKVVPHHGVDFAAPAGTPVVAAADGRVAFTGFSGGLGRAVRLRHGSEYETVYGHLSRIAAGVRQGTTVRQNQVIGYVGSTGLATGPHLHYTLIERGRPIDPLRFANPPVAPLGPDFDPDLARAKLTWLPLLGSIPLEIEVASRTSRMPDA